MILGAALSVAVAPPLGAAFGSLEAGLAVIDVAMLIAFVALAHKSKEAWLIWLSGFQLLIILSHFPILLRPLITPEGYVMINGLWPWLMMFALVSVTARRIWLRRKRGIGIFSRDC